MSFISMAKEMLGDVPGLSLPYAQTLLNRALQLIYDEQRWSFQKQDGGWIVPGLYTPSQYGSSGGLSPGLITVEPYSNVVYGDQVAQKLWASGFGRPLVTEQQLRLPYGPIYNIVSVDSVTHAPFTVLILDRPWMDLPVVLQPYMIYQVYFPTPVGFRTFRGIRDMVNLNRIEWKKYDQAWLARNDPQRTTYGPPVMAVPYKPDTRVGSVTAGAMMYELWPHCVTPFTLSWNALVSGPLMSAPTDTVPYPLSEELVLWRGKEQGYLWKESQRGDGMERGSGADWRFLAQEAHEQASLRMKQVKLLDLQLDDQYWDKFERGPGIDEGYVTRFGVTNVGTF